MRRDLWSKSIGEHFMPEWPCPVCHRGHTQLVAKSLRYEETEESKRLHDHEAWDPDWIVYVFTAWGECSHQGCKQLFAISGTGSVDQYYTEEGEDETYAYFKPSVCHPMPDIITLPAKSPDSVDRELRIAFALFWRHREACAGRIRVALEMLMDYLQIPRRRKTKAGKFTDLVLHSRLQVLSERSPAIGSQLMALKWLGNSGAHDGAVSGEDLLDAFEILEHSLAELIEQRSDRIAQLAKKLTRKHAKRAP
jgi:hypothetical protein